MPFYSRLHYFCLYTGALEWRIYWWIFHRAGYSSGLLSVSIYFCVLYWTSSSYDINASDLSHWISMHVGRGRTFIFYLLFADDLSFLKYPLSNYLLFGRFWIPFVLFQVRGLTQIKQFCYFLETFHWMWGKPFSCFLFLHFWKDIWRFCLLMGEWKRSILS